MGCGCGVYDVCVQLDVKTIFHNVDLEGKFHMKPLQGFVIPGRESEACWLQKSLYSRDHCSKH